MESLKSEIKFLILEINDIALILTKAYAILEKVEEPHLKKDYAFQLLPIIDRFKAIRLEMLPKLEQYFIEEQKDNQPVNFLYKKLYRDLKREV